MFFKYLSKVNFNFLNKNINCDSVEYNKIINTLNNMNKGNFNYTLTHPKVTSMISQNRIMIDDKAYSIIVEVNSLTKNSCMYVVHNTNKHLVV